MSIRLLQALFETLTDNFCEEIQGFSEWSWSAGCFCNASGADVFLTYCFHSSKVSRPSFSRSSRWIVSRQIIPLQKKNYWFSPQINFKIYIFNLNSFWGQAGMPTKTLLNYKTQVHTKVIPAEWSLSKGFVGVTWSWLLQRKWYLRWIRLRCIKTGH